MSEPCKCDCQKLVIALLDRADALHREEVAMIECGNAGAYSKLMKLQAENERLRKAGDAMSYALQTCKYSAEEIAHYSDAWQAALDRQP